MIAPERALAPVRPLRVYVAAPLGLNDAGRPARIQVAIDAGRALFAALLHAVVPHLWALIPGVDDWQGYRAWMSWCLGELATCDVVLRLPGESPGADEEVARAIELGIPVFYSIDEVIAHAHRRCTSRRTSSRTTASGSGAACPSCSAAIGRATRRSARGRRARG